MERNAEQVAQLVELMREADAKRVEADARLDALAASVGQLARALEEDREAKGEDETPALLARIAAAQEAAAGFLEAQAREEEEAEGPMRLRSIDTQLARIAEEIASGRADATAEIRMDLARLTRAVLGETGPRGEDR